MEARKSFNGLPLYLLGLPILSTYCLKLDLESGLKNFCVHLDMCLSGRTSTVTAHAASQASQRAV